MADDTTPLRATVMICTRNRAESLRRMLNSVVSAARTVTAPWELVVVDNGSTDHTAKVIASFDGILPIRRVTEETPGKSKACNAGVAVAEGEFIIWADDDVLVDEGWLNAYLTAFDRFPDLDMFGGRAVPRYEEPRQDWFIRAERYMEGLLAIRDNPDWTEITPDRAPYGLNYAVRTALHRRVPFNPALGVAPGRRLGGEETDFVARALATGARGRWVWDATVYHLITPERQSAGYIYDYYYAQGVLYYQFAGNASLLHRARHFLALAVRMAQRKWAAQMLRARGDVAWVAAHIEYARLRGNWDRLRQNNPDFT